MRIGIISILLFLSSTILLSLTVPAWGHRERALGKSFIALCLSIAIYNLGYGMELASANLTTLIVWSKFQYLGIPFIPTFFFLFAANYTGIRDRIPLPLVFYLVGFPCITMVLHLTQEHHNLMYINPTIHRVWNMSFLAFDKGLWYKISRWHVAVIISAGAILFLRFFLQSVAVFRRQSILILIGALFPWAGWLVYMLDILPSGFDPTPFALFLASLFLASALLRYRLFDVSPIAKEQVFESIDTGVLVLDSEKRLVDYNHAASLVFSALTKEKKGVYGEDLFKNITSGNRLFEESDSGDVSVDIQIASGDSLRHYWARRSSIRTPKGRVLGSLILLDDITNRVRLLEKMETLASKDPLTGISNRRHLSSFGEKEVVRALHYGTNLVLIMFDLDLFKKVNDTYGHDVGDQLLIHIVEIARGLVREADLLGRYGGEEFVILLPQTSLSDAQLIAERIRSSIEISPLLLESGTSIPITASFGVTSSFGSSDFSFESLCKKADEALYRAKAEGRNQVVTFLGTDNE